MHENINWESWISNFREKTLKTYENEPDRIREDFGSEARVSDDYKGRALLELLQNADDAQQPESEITTKVGGTEAIFILTKEAFYCANGGYMMTAQGLNSICRLSHSPKDRSRLTIGEKGLGFKSVLSFSKIPEIHSGNLHCSFDRQESYRFIHSSSVIKETRPDLTVDAVPLLRIPVWCDSTCWENDALLTQLVENYATVIKLPILTSDYQIIREKLDGIKPTILLFLNFLETIEVRVIDETPRRCFVVREKPTKYGSCDVSQSILEGEKDDTVWLTIKGSEDVPQEALEGLGFGWENVQQCGLAFAVQKTGAGFVPLNDSFDNSIRVFFPTTESFPLPLLFHATYYTDSARKSINIEHKYNEHVTEKAAEFFISNIIPQIVHSSLSDPGAHLDLIRNLPQKDNTVGKHFGDLLFSRLSEIEIVPDSKGGLQLPGKLKRLPFDLTKWGDWYSLLGEKGRIALSLVHIKCAENNRLEFLDSLGVQLASFNELISALGASANMDPAWFSKAYTLINDYVQAQTGHEKVGVEQSCLQSELLFTSDKGMVSGDAVKVFMPPDAEGIEDIPTWLKIRFVNQEVVKALGQTKEQALNTFLTRFGVKRFQVRDILREVLSTSLDEYWDGEDDSLIPLELLRFLFKLLQQELGDKLERPEKSVFSILMKVPVPALDPSGDFHWSKAGNTYFSQQWLKNDHLETLYSFDPESRFLCGTDYFESKGLSGDSLFSFLYYLGVENQPRLLEPTNIAEMVSLTKEDEFSNYRVSNNIIKQSEFNELDYDCTIDRIEATMKMPDQSRALLNYLAKNPHLCFNTTSARYKHRPDYRYNWSYQSLLTNYLKWLLENSAWLYDSFGNGYKPSEIYMGYEGLRQRFGKYVPYVYWESEKNKASWQDIRSLLIKVGVRDNLEEFTVEQWYNIVSKIPGEWENKDITEEDAEKIRAIYREFLRSKVNIDDKAKEFKENFISSGKLLAFHKGKYDFFTIQEVFYVDRLDLFYQLRDYVPCFQIETNRDLRVEELFSVPSLTASLHVAPDIGSNDPTLKDPLNAFIKDAKPFLLARVRSRRNLKTDVSQIRELVINPVTRITVQRTIKHQNTDTEIVIPKTEVESVLLQEDHEGGKCWVIYIDARIIKRGIAHYMQFRQDDDLISIISARLSELLKIDLSEAFQLILSRDANSRKKILQDNHVDEELLRECYTILAQKEDEPIREKMPVPSPSEEETEHENEPAEEPEPVNNNSGNDPVKQRVLWGEGASKMSYENAGEAPGSKKEDEANRGQGRPGFRHHYQRDTELKQRTDNAGMKIVMDYERSALRIPDDSPSKQRGGVNRAGPGCDVHSRDQAGKLVRRIEVKSSLYDDIEAVELTRSELETARNNFTGTDFYIYRVIKLDEDKYPSGPELLIFHDPYKEGASQVIPISVRFNLDNLKREKVVITPTKQAQEDVA